LLSFSNFVAAMFIQYVLIVTLINYECTQTLGLEYRIVFMCLSVLLRMTPSPRGVKTVCL